MQPEGAQTLWSQLELLSTELQACKKKLISKTEALNILYAELEDTREERDHLKNAKSNGLSSGVELSSLRLSPALVEENQSLSIEADHLRKKNHELTLQNQLLTAKLKVRRDVALSNAPVPAPPDPASINGNGSSKSQLLDHLEHWSKMIQKLHVEVKSLTDDKSDLTAELTACQQDNSRLVQTLAYLLELPPDSAQFTRMDSIISQNRYLAARNSHLAAETQAATAATKKYKRILSSQAITENSPSAHGNDKQALPVSRKRISVTALSDALSAGNLEAVINGVLSTNSQTQTIADLHSITRSLLDNLLDKQTALQHQRKMNRLLAERVTELEASLVACQQDAFKRRVVARRKSLERCLERHSSVHGGGVRLSQSADCIKAYGPVRDDDFAGEQLTKKTGRKPLNSYS